MASSAWPVASLMPFLAFVANRCAYRFSSALLGYSTVGWAAAAARRLSLRAARTVSSRGVRPDGSRGLLPVFEMQRVARWGAGAAGWR